MFRTSSNILRKEPKISPSCILRIEAILVFSSLFCFLDCIGKELMIIFDMSDSFQKEHGCSTDPDVQYEGLIVI